MKKIIYLAVLSIPLIALPQSIDINELSLTESMFSLTSQTMGLRNGFLRYTDPDAIGINQDGFSKLYKIWSDRPDSRQGPALVWLPETVTTNSSNNFGVSSGPYYTKSSKDSVLMHAGYYFTVWCKVSGKYKIVFDGGVRLTNMKIPTYPPDLSSRIMKPGNQDKKKKEFSENEFILFAATNDFKKVIQTYAIAEYEILLTGHGKLKLNEISRHPFFANRLMVKQIGSRVSTDRSMLMTYGQISVNSDQTPKGYYVNVWEWRTSQYKLIATLCKLDQ